MASASLLKTSPVVDKSEWVKGQTLRQPSVAVVRCHPVAPSGLTVRASSYADELVKTAVSVNLLKIYIYANTDQYHVTDMELLGWLMVVENYCFSRPWNFGHG